MTRCRILLLVAAATTIACHLASLEVSALDTDAELEPGAKPWPPEPLESEAAVGGSTEEPAEASPESRASVATRKSKHGYKCGLARLNKLSRRKSRSVVGPDDHVAAQITNGDDEHYGSWPSFVKVGIRESATGNMFTCGGTLVTDRHVLTAAHCTNYNEGRTLYRPDEYRVKIGDHSTSRTDQYEAKLPVKRVCQAPNYKPGGAVSYDWTILELKSPVKFSDHVQPACLAQKMPPTKGSKAVCYLVGAGAVRGVSKREIKSQSEGDEPGESRRAAPPKRRKSLSKYKDIVQELQVAQSDCKDWGLSRSDKSRICFLGFKAGGDACGGDSGGPILCLSPQNRWTVVGIVSYGSSRCESEGVYTDVHKLLGEMMQSCPSIKGHPMG